MNIDDGKHERRVEVEVEQWLDEGIARYAKVEPRAGLEGRVLGRLAEARKETREGASRSFRWWGALALGAAAGSLVVLALLGVVDRETIPQTPVVKIEVPPQTNKSVANGGGQGTASSEVASSKSGSSKLASGRLGRGHGGAQSNSPPTRERFPSPSSLTDQEEMLARYVREFPERATLVARAQTELRKQDEREMAAPWPANVNSTERQE